MSKPYSNETQIFTFGVHGTVNNPSHIREVVQDISTGVGRTTKGANLWDNGFSWESNGFPFREGTSHGFNQNTDRTLAADRYAKHVLQQIDKAMDNGTMSRDKPLVVNLVGFSHGGNVAIQAADDIAEGLKKRGIDGAIHLTTLSTPAYRNNATGQNIEDPENAKRAVQAQGVKFAHTAFWTEGDGVVGRPVSPIGIPTGPALGGNNFPGAKNHTFEPLPESAFRNNPFPFNQAFIANHGALQDYEPYRQRAANTLEQRFLGLAPAQKRADAGDLEGTQIASLPKDFARQSNQSGQPSTITGFEDLKPKDGGRAMLDTVESRYFRVGENTVQNPHADRFAGLMKDLESPNFSIDKQKDNAAALLEATMVAKFKPDQNVQAMVGPKDNLIAMQGSGDLVNRVSVDIGKTDGAFQRVSDAVVAQATQQSQTAAAPAPNQEPEQRKQASPTIV
jgi:hypothetical protein